VLSPIPGVVVLVMLLLLVLLLLFLLLFILLLLVLLLVLLPPPRLPSLCRLLLGSLCLGPGAALPLPTLVVRRSVPVRTSPLRVGV